MPESDHDNLRHLDFLQKSLGEAGQRRRSGPWAYIGKSNDEIKRKVL